MSDVGFVVVWGLVIVIIDELISQRWLLGALTPFFVLQPINPVSLEG